MHTDNSGTDLISNLAGIDFDLSIQRPITQCVAGDVCNNSTGIVQIVEYLHYANAILGVSL